MLSKCTTSEKYLELVSHQIPVNDLYMPVKTCSRSQENIYCPVLIQITNKELQMMYRGRYLLQVWDIHGSLIYSKILQYNIHTWNMLGNFLVFILNEREPNDERQF